MGGDFRTRPREPYDAEFLRDIETSRRSSAEMVAAQSWAKFWRAGHAARYDQLSPFLRDCVFTQHGYNPDADSLWRFYDGEAIPAA
jgi:hypothetical protein